MLEQQRRGETHRRTGLLVAVMAGLLWTAMPTTAQAGQLDKALLTHSSDILDFLHRNKYRNVGILPFQVKKGTRKASYNAAPLAVNLTNRLETALLVTLDEEETNLNIIHDATKTANQQGVGAYMTSAAAFDRLFKTSYPLGFGTRKVQPSAFLTGIVENTGDRAKTKVTIVAFDAKSRSTGKLRMRQVKQFTVDTDRPLLSDLGYSYALSMTAMRRAYDGKARTKMALSLVARRDQNGDNNPGNGGSNAYTPDNIAGFAFEVLYDGVKQDVKPLQGAAQGQRGQTFQVGNAAADAQVEFALTRNVEDARTYGVLIAVNGESLWNKENADPPIVCRKWVYAPERRGTRDIFKGFYTGLEGKNLLKFKSLTAEESVARAQEMGNKAGWIDVVVFVSKEGPPGPGGEPEMLISLRGGLKGKRPANLATYQKRLLAVNRLKHRVRIVAKRTTSGLLVHDAEPIEGFKIPEAELNNPEELARIKIRYWGTDEVAPEMLIAK